LFVASLVLFLANVLTAYTANRDSHQYVEVVGKAKLVNIDSIRRRGTKSTQQLYALRMNFISSVNDGGPTSSRPLFESVGKQVTESSFEEAKSVAEQYIKKETLQAFCSSTECVIQPGISSNNYIWLILSLVASVAFFPVFHRRAV
jgi:hypothetical protein